MKRTAMSIALALGLSMTAFAADIPVGEGVSYTDLRSYRVAVIRAYCYSIAKDKQLNTRTYTYLNCLQQHKIQITSPLPEGFLGETI